MKRKLSTVLGVLVLTTGLWPLGADDAAEIQSLTRAGQWEEAIPLLQKLTAAEPGDGRAWFQLATAYGHIENREGQLAAAERALELGFQPRLAHLAMALAHASLGDEGSALDRVEQFAAGGTSAGLKQLLEGKPELATLHDEPRWQAAVELVTPCRTEAYRQFDFWLGDFAVEDPTGTYVGDNQITSHLGGCMLMESWQGATGMHGMSMNFYDPADDTWNQIFVDNNGAPANWPPLKGRLDDSGRMILWTPEGEARSRWTWTRVNEDKVRQMAESTTDGGKTWQVVWDSYYVRKK